MQEEQKCKSHYVQHTASNFYGVTKHWYLYCNRSGITRLRGEGKRQLKSQGSCKIGKACIANMKIMQDAITGKVIVEYCSAQNSHSSELAHLPVLQDVQYKIAAKLHDGVSIEKVLDSIRDDMS